MQWTSIGKRVSDHINAKHKWHRWYAWYPITFTAGRGIIGQTVWLETIERQKINIGHDRVIGKWEYRPAGSGKGEAKT